MAFFKIQDGPHKQYSGNQIMHNYDICISCFKAKFLMRIYLIKRHLEVNYSCILKSKMSARSDIVKSRLCIIMMFASNILKLNF